MSKVTDHRVTQTHGISTGAGIAVSVVWLAASAASVIFTLVCFVWTTTGKTVFTDLSIFGLFIFVFLLAPFFGAYLVTGLIVTGKEF